MGTRALELVRQQHVKQCPWVATWLLAKQPQLIHHGAAGKAVVIPLGFRGTPGALLAAKEALHELTRLIPIKQLVVCPGAYASPDPLHATMLPVPRRILLYHVCHHAESGI
jgi:hypothetical protein